MRNLGPPLVFLALLLLGWEVLHLQIANGSISSPREAGARLVALMSGARFWADVGETGFAFVIACLLSIMFGVLIGVGLGLSRLATEAFEPILVTFYSLPKVILYPLVLLAFGLGASAKIAFGVMHGLVPMALLTRNAIAEIKPVYLRSAKVMQLDGFATLRLVLLPAILPELVGGMRIAFSLSLLGVLIGEMFAAKRGLGFAAMNAMGLGDINTILAIGLFLGTFSVLANVMMLSVERSLRHVHSNSVTQAA